VTVAATLPSITAGAARRPAYLPHVGPSSHSPLPPPSLDDTWAGGPPFRLVLPRDKRDRLAARAAGLTRLRACSVASCQAEGMPVLLVDAELEAVLCPVHQLVLLDGSAVEGQPMLATAAW
jgi:hypothetical protein